MIKRYKIVATNPESSVVSEYKPSYQRLTVLIRQKITLPNF